MPSLKRDKARLPKEIRLEVVEKTVQWTPLNATHWTCAMMGEAVGISPSSLWRIRIGMSG